MYKNQLQELAQRSCFNLPAYGCIREGPDHAPRFKASVNFNGEIFQSPCYCPTLRQAEHAAAELALNVLSSRGSKSLTARVLDETGVYKNLLQETAHKAGLNLPVYTTVRTGPGHVPVFTCTVELAGMSFTGEPAKTKKQAEKNAAIAAWSSLKKAVPKLASQKGEGKHDNDYEQDQVVVARVLSCFRPKMGGKTKDQYARRSRNARIRRPDNLHLNSSKFKNPEPEPIEQKGSFIDLLPPPPPRTTSKILPLATATKCPRNRGGQDGKFLQECPKRVTTKGALKEQGQTHFRGLFLGPTTTNPSTVLKRVSAIPNLSCAQMGILGNYSINPKGVAPAVQVRSVIPVCAAPPPPPSLKPFPLLKPTHLSSELSKLRVKGE